MSALDSLRDQLGLASGAVITLERMTFEQWGKYVVFAAVSGEAAFRLNFADVRDLRWRTYVMGEGGEADTGFSTSALVDFSFGRDQHRSPAQLLSEHFGASLFYGTLTLDRL